MKKLDRVVFIIGCISSVIATVVVIKDLSNTPRKQIEADWLDSKKDESQSVTVEDFIKLNRELNVKNSENK